MANWWDDPDLKQTDQKSQSQQKPSGLWESFKQNVLEPATHATAVIGEGALHALPDTIGFAGDVGAGLVKIAQDPMRGSTIFDVARQPIGKGPVSSRVNKSFEQAEQRANAPTPRNTFEKYANITSRGAADSLIGGPGAPLRTMAAGASGALASQVTYDLTGNEDLANVAGIAGMFAPEAVRGIIKGRQPVPETLETGKDIVPVEGESASQGGGAPEGTFRTAKEAARHIVDNKLGGTHDIVANDDGSYSVAQTRGFAAKDINDVIVGDLEGGGSIEHPNVSPKGAMGPQQVMPETARKPGFNIKPWDGKTQTDLARVGRQYTQALTKKYNGDAQKVLAAYNAGPGRVDNLVKRYGPEWVIHLPDETKKYVRNGLSKLGVAPSAADEYKAALAQNPLYKDYFTTGDELPTDSKGNHLKLPEDYTDDEWSKLSLKDKSSSSTFAYQLENKQAPWEKEEPTTFISNKGPEPGTPEFDKKYGYNEDDLVYDDDPYEDLAQYEDFEPEYDEPKPHYDYIGSPLPYDQYAKNTGIQVDLDQKHAIEHVASKLGVHPWDVAEAYLNKDDFVGLDVDKTIDQVNKYLKYLNVQNSKPKYYAPFQYGTKHYVSQADYEKVTGKKIGPLTTQAIKQYALDNGQPKKSIESHYFSETGDPTIKEGVNLWRDNLAKEQMTPKEYAAYQKLPTDDPKVLKILKKYLEPQLTPEQKVKAYPKPESKLAKAADTFVRMLKDNSGGAAVPEDIHTAITEWNKGTHYLMKGPDGTPLRIYHGTKYHYEGMPSGEKNRMPYGYVLYSTDPDFASGYARFDPYDIYDSASRVFPAYVKNDPSIADFRKPEDLAKAINWYTDKKKNNWGVEADLAEGSWHNWENPDMLRDNGWRGAFMTEGNGKGGKSLNVMLRDDLVYSVFDPNTYKNNTVGHKVVKALEGVAKDDTSALSVPKGMEDKPGPTSRFVKTFVEMLKDDSGSLNGNDEPGYIEKLRDALKSAVKLNKEQREMHAAERSIRAGKLDEVQKNTSGKEGYFESLGALKGQYPKVDFEINLEHFTEEDIKNLFDHVKNEPTFTPFDKLNAQTGLIKLLGGDADLGNAGPKAGSVPTESELKLLSQVLPDDIITTLLKHRTLAKRVWDNLANVLNVPRALMASFDLSAPMRQGVFLIGTKEFWTNWGTMFKTFGSEKTYQAVLDEIKNRPTYKMMKQAGLSLTDTGHFLANREEQFQSPLAEKIPIIGHGVRMSDRAYSAFLTKLRADTFDSLVRDYQSAGVSLAGKDGAARIKSMARYINNATGRGNLPRQLETAAPQLNAIFFSPKLMASRVQMLYPGFYMNLDPIVRRRALKNLMAFGAIGMTVLALAKWGGADVDPDPRHPDGWKIKTGDTRREIFGGWTPFVRLGATLLTITTQLASGYTVNDKGHFVKKHKGLTTYHKVDAPDSIGRFLRNKLSPISSLVVDFYKGKDSVGNKFTWTKSIENRMIPMVIQDIADIIHDQKGVTPRTVETTAESTFGVGVQTYKKKPKKSKSKSSHSDEWWRDM